MEFIPLAVCLLLFLLNPQIVKTQSNGLTLSLILIHLTVIRPFVVIIVCPEQHIGI